MKNPQNTNRHHLDFGNWFQVYRPFFQLMTHTEAIILSFLINQQRRWSDDPDGWFYCKVETILNAVGIPKPSQSRLLANLQKRGFLSIQRRDNPSKRYVQIHYHNIMNAVDGTIIYTDTDKE